MQNNATVSLAVNKFVDLSEIVTHRFMCNIVLQISSKMQTVHWIKLIQLVKTKWKVAEMTYQRQETEAEGCSSSLSR